MATPNYVAGEVWTAAYANSIGMHLIKTQTIGTAVSTVAVTNAFSTDYDNYKITVTGGVASATVALRMVLGATATGYYGGLTRTTYSTAAVSGLADNNAVRFSYVGVGTTDTLYVNAELFQPFLSKRTFINSSNIAAGSTLYGGFYGGFLDNATSYTDFTISPESGTITGGTVRVYGYRNSLT